jgi:MFS family permease
MRRRLFADRNFRLLFAGQMVNTFGNQAMIIVLGIWVKQLTGSNGMAGLIFMLLAIPAPLAPFTGLLVDRLPRRRVLIGNDLVSAATVLCLLLVHDRGDVWILYAVALGYGLSNQIYRSARGGLIHSMLPAELLGEANGLFGALGQGMRIIGPVIGAGLYALAGGDVVAMVDAATFLVSVGCYLLLARVRDLSRTRAQTQSRLLHELLAGARHVLITPDLRRMVIAATVAFSTAGTIDVAIFALIDQGLHRPATFLGVLVTVQGAGSVVGGLAVGAVIRRLGEFGAACLGFIVCAAGLALGATASLPAVYAGAVLAGFALPTILVASLTLVQRRTPNEMQGRAIAASDAITDVPFAVSIAVGAAIITAVGFRTIYLVDAAVFAAAAVLLLPRVRATRPDRVPAPATAT